MKTIIITGASSGIGKETALLFASRGWRVAATMRNPKNLTMFEGQKNIRTYRGHTTNGIENLFSMPRRSLYSRKINFS